MKKFGLFVLILMLTGFIFGSKVVKIPDILKPTTIAVDDDQLYITEAATIYIYSLKDFSLKKKFGKKGEGPQEFNVNPMRGIRLHIQPDQIIVDCQGKVAYYGKDGTFKKEMRSVPTFAQYMPLGEKFAGIGFAGDSKGGYIAVSIYDSHLKKEKEIHKMSVPNPEKDGINPITVLTLPYLYTCDNKIFVGGKDGSIEAFDAGGQKLPPIIKEYKKVKITQEHKKKYIQFFSTDQRFKAFYERDKNRIGFSEYFPIVRNFHIEDKILYILTFREEDGKSEFLIYDINGKLLKTTLLPFEEMSPIALYPYTIKKGKLYQLIDNPKTEEWELHITEVR